MDLIEFFGDENFDAGEYVKKFFENNSSSGATARCVELESLRRQTEETLRQEVVRNYQTFMLATTQIQSMEKDIDTLRSSLAVASDTLGALQNIRLIEKLETNNRQLTSTAPDALDPFLLGAKQINQVATRGLKHPEFLDKAPTELEELLLERKHEAAVLLIRRVKDFAANVRDAHNLGQKVASIFAQAEQMASKLSNRLILEISATNTFTAWGHREHKKNFELLIDLGYADIAALAFVKERTALIRRTVHTIETTSDPLNYAREISSIFFSQALDSVTAFLKLFCSNNYLPNDSGPLKAGKSSAYIQIYQGIRLCGSAPFCRLLMWLDVQIAQFSKLVGRQIRAVALGAHASRPADSQLPLATSSLAIPDMDPVVCNLFATVSLMLEDCFIAASRMNQHGFPVGIPLATHLHIDVIAFLDAYAKRANESVLEVGTRDDMVLRQYKILPPESLLGPGSEARELVLGLTTSGASAVCEARTLLECGLMLLDPPPQSGSYYTRQNFAELQPHLLKLISMIAISGSTATLGAIHESDLEQCLTYSEASASFDSLSILADEFAPCIAAWCLEMFPEMLGKIEINRFLTDVQTAYSESALEVSEVMGNLKLGTSIFDATTHPQRQMMKHSMEMERALKEEDQSEDNDDGVSVARDRQQSSIATGNDSEAYEDVDDMAVF